MRRDAVKSLAQPLTCRARLFGLLVLLLALSLWLMACRSETVVNNNAAPQPTPAGPQPSAFDGSRAFEHVRKQSSSVRVPQVHRNWRRRASTSRAS
jgi:hypothetical protein